MALLAAAALLFGVADPSGARAGGVGSVIQAGTAGALAVTVSQTQFAPGSVAGVVIADTSEPAAAAVAAAYAGGAAGRVPLLFVDSGAGDGVVRQEIARVTGGADAAERPVVWLAAADLDGLGDYDVRDLGDTAAEVSAGVLSMAPAAGTGNRVLLFDPTDWRAGAIAAGFGAAYGVPVLAGGSAPPGLATTPKPIAIAVGSVPVADGAWSEVRRVEGTGPAALSAAAAEALVASEHPAGAPLPAQLPVRPVAADGFGTDPGPALLASVVAAATQAAGARGPVLLVDSRPPADLAGACKAGGRDGAALCAMDKADGETTVLALTASKRDDAVVAAGRLPATGRAAAPLIAVLAALALLVVRRVATR